MELESIPLSEEPNHPDPSSTPEPEGDANEADEDDKEEENEDEEEEIYLYQLHLHDLFALTMRRFNLCNHHKLVSAAMLGKTDS